MLADLPEEEKKELLSHMPEGQQTEEFLKENLCSPQMLQSLQSLTSALKYSQENLDVTMLMCDLGEQQPDFNMGAIEALVKAFVKKYSEKKD